MRNSKLKNIVTKLVDIQVIEDDNYSKALGFFVLKLTAFPLDGVELRKLSLRAEFFGSGHRFAPENLGNRSINTLMSQDILK